MLNLVLRFIRFFKNKPIPRIIEKILSQSMGFLSHRRPLIIDERITTHQ